MLLIVHKIWHEISPEGYRQVLTKINQNYICQQGNILLDNLRVLDLVRMSRSHVKGQRCGGVCIFWMLLVFSSFLFLLVVKWQNSMEKGNITILLCPDCDTCDIDLVFEDWSLFLLLTGSPATWDYITVPIGRFLLNLDKN